MMRTMTHSQPLIDEILTAMMQKNLVYNHDFRYFSHADYSVNPIEYGVPDGWTYSDPGPAGSINSCDNQLIIVTSNDDTSKMKFKQRLNEFPRWQSTLANQIVTAKVHMTITADSLVAVSLTDGDNASYEAKYCGQDEAVELEVQIKLSETPKELSFSLESEANAATIKISKIYANIGTLPMANLPCMVAGVIGQTKQYLGTENPPNEELSLCENAIELTDNQSRLNTVINGRFGLGANERSLLPDVRGQFMRAWDHGANTDPDAKDRVPLGTGSKNSGDHVGSKQEDIFKSHHHTIPFQVSALKPSGDSAPVHPVDELKETDTSDVGGEETRPKNVYVLYTIKWA